MKKIAAALTALALLLSAFALAFEGAGYPGWDGVTAPENGLNATFGMDRISLSFDPSADFSNVLDGTVQACFFAYDASEEHYLELYLLLPQDAAPGDVFQSGDGKNCAIFLYETSLSGETFYYAGSEDADGSSYALSLDAVERDATMLGMGGSFSARLCRYSADRPTQDFLTVSEASFRFVLPLNSLPSPTQAPGGGAPSLPEATDPPFPGEPEASVAPFPAFPSEPEASAAPFPAFPDAPHASHSPAFTLPPDYVEL